MCDHVISRTRLCCRPFVAIYCDCADMCRDSVRLLHTLVPSMGAHSLSIAGAVLRVCLRAHAHVSWKRKELVVIPRLAMTVGWSAGS